MKWCPTGVTALESYRLSNKDRQGLRDTLGNYGIDKPSPELFRDVESALAYYHADSRLHQDCLPSKVRKNLRAVGRWCEALLAALDKLDGVSRDLLHTEAGMDLSEVRLKLETWLIATGRAEQAAAVFPNTRLHDFPKLFLAYNIKQALQNHGHSVTARKPGLFYDLVAYVFQTATGQEKGEVEKMVRAALRINNPDRHTPTD